MSNPWTDRELSRKIHAIPLWVALRWFVVALFRGPERAERYIRPQDRT